MLTIRLSVVCFSFSLQWWWWRGKMVRKNAIRREIRWKVQKENSITFYVCIRDREMKIGDLVRSS